MEKSHDRLGRRLRVPLSEGYKGYRFNRIETGSSHFVTVRDLKFLHIHGEHQTTSSLFEATKHLGKNFKSLQHRLPILTHEMGLLTRPPQQLNCYMPSRNDLIYRLTPKAFDVLEENGLLRENVVDTSSHFAHQVMQSYCLAWFDLNSRETKLNFVPQHEITSVNHLTVGDRRVYPDGMFMLTDGQKSLLIFLEIDRDTEAVRSWKTNKQSIELKLKHYREIIGKGIYKKQLGITCGAFVLFVTVNQRREDAILDAVKEVVGKNSYILTTHEDGFDFDFSPPKNIDLLGRKWHRSGHPDWQFPVT